MTKSSYNAFAVPAIQSNIMIMTREDFIREIQTAFTAGVERGKFEAGMPDATPRTVSDEEHRKVIDIAKGKEQ